MKLGITIATLFVAVSAFAVGQDKCASGSCSEGKKVTAEDQFMKEAERMMMEAEGKKACCKSTPEKPVAKGEKGCCNAKGELAKFKVWVGDKYAYFGCEGSAKKARNELMKKGMANIGPVQKVKGKVAL
jgi:hypothetical protein